MEIHIVQEGETIYTIAEKYNVSAKRLIIDNDINPDKLVIGQALVILYPAETYIVKQGDTLESIANEFNIPVMQLYRNNNFLSERDNIFPGETLVIKYNNIGKINTFGFIFPHIDDQILKKTLPYLTYLCISGNQITNEADIISINDDEIIRLTKSFGVVPIMLISSLIQEELNYVDSTYNLLNNEILLEKLINNIMQTLKNKGYQGLCITIEYLSSFNFILYERYIKKLASIFKIENLQLFVAISPDSLNVSSEVVKVIDPNIEDYLNGIIFMNFNKSIGVFSPPMPITSMTKLNDFLKVCLTIIDENKVNIGCPVLGLDWQLPYVANVSTLTIIKYNTAIDIAKENNSAINLDPISQTPYFTYTVKNTRDQTQHIVWFIDANTINSIMVSVSNYKLSGMGMWNIMFFFAPLWALVNSEYEINKLLKEP